MNRSFLEITSTANPRVKEALHLWDKRDRDRTDKFLIEGYRELLRAIDAGHPIDCLFICRPFFLGSNEESLILKLQKNNVPILDCTERVFRKISYRDRPDGLLAIAPQQHLTLDHLKHKEDLFLLVAEAIEKPGNLGTLLRSADAVGLDAVLLCDPCTDIHNPNVVRSSIGCLFTVPVIETDSATALQWLKKHQVSVIATTPYASEEFTDSRLVGSLAIVVGTEQLGLTNQWLEAADQQVRIPMLGKADSLNVATAATLLLYEALRQRRRT